MGVPVTWRWSLRTAAGLLLAVSALRAQPPVARVPAPAFLNMPESLPGLQDYAFTPAFPRIAFDAAVRLAYDPRGDRYYVAEVPGRVRSFPNDPNTAEATLVLDLSAVTQTGWDAGLLGLVLHPEFGEPNSPNRGHFYVWYNHTDNKVPAPSDDPFATPARTPSTNRLSRFTIPAGTLQADPASELVLIDQPSDFLMHNGGAMFFHPADGFLYIAVGDDWYPLSGVPPPLTRQQIDYRLASGVLRIDVDMDPARSHPIRRQPTGGQTANYYIPDDNPFVDPNGDSLEEFYALGLRSPHTMTYDEGTGRVWIGDVGQFEMEELDLLEAGANYQWPYREGVLPLEDPPAVIIGHERPPVYAYGRSSARCVIGGHVYRGAALPELVGTFVFADFYNNQVFGLTLDAGGAAQVDEIGRVPGAANRPGGVTGIVEAADGELLFLRNNSHLIYRMTRAVEVAVPQLLSQTGAFADVASLTPSAYALPYDVNAPLWSDGARKRRWIAVPEDGDGALEPDREQLGFAPAGEWRFPPGTVLIKHFELPTDERDPAILRRLETRLLVQQADGEVYGVTYRWRDDGSDAELLTTGLAEDVDVRLSDGRTARQTWTYPSPTDCLTCHTANAGGVLGVKTRQLNRAFPGTSAAHDNQLAVWSRLGLLDTTVSAEQANSFDRLVPVDDAEAGLEQRVRSYLDANCSQCHRPGGARAEWDARYDTPLIEQGIIDALANSSAAPDDRIVAPGDPQRSVLLRRMQRFGGAQMPPLARAVLDSDALALISAWIESLVDDDDPDDDGDGDEPNAPTEPEPDPDGPPDPADPVDPVDPDPGDGDPQDLPDGPGDGNDGSDDDNGSDGDADAPEQDAPDDGPLAGCPPCLLPLLPVFVLPWLVSRVRARARRAPA